MLGVSFENSVPQPKREEVAMSAEIADVLTEMDLVSDLSTLSHEDYVSISSRAALLKSSHMNEDASIALAYVDRKVNQERTVGNTGEVILSKMTPGIIAPLLPVSLASNTEFADTVLALSKKNFLEGLYPSYSDALLAAIGSRIQEYNGITPIGGKLDKEDNVVQPTDEQLLR